LKRGDAGEHLTAFGAGDFMPANNAAQATHAQNSIYDYALLLERGNKPCPIGLEVEMNRLAATAPEAGLLVRQLADCVHRHDFIALHTVLGESA
jgi:hypothetical protein